MATIDEANAAMTLLRYMLGWSIDPDAARKAAGDLTGRAYQLLGTGLTPEEVAHRWRRLAYLAETGRERDRVWRRMGGMTPPDGTGTPELRKAAEEARRAACEEFRDTGGSWVALFTEEVAKAFAQEDAAALRAQLVTVAAHALCWVEGIDRREQPEVTT